jgi:hypothetical protein
MESAHFMNSSRRMVNTHTHTKQELAAASQPPRKRKFALAPIKFSTIHSKTKFIRTKQNCMDKKDKIGK